MSFSENRPEKNSIEITAFFLLSGWMANVENRVNRAGKIPAADHRAKAMNNYYQ
jgi:hypothetical protein